MGAFADWFEFTREAGREAILSSKAIQLTCLGVADCYQSCETVQNYLVDPDNRRPADFAGLAATNKALASREPASLAEEKLHLTRAILRLRRRRAEAFVGPKATYRPLPSSSGHVLSFARGADSEVVVVASRLASPNAAHGGFSGHTVVLPEGRWFDVLTGQEYDGGPVELTSLLRAFPCAVLEEVSESEPTTTLRAVTGAARPASRAPQTTDQAGSDASGLLGWLTRKLSGGHQRVRTRQCCNDCPSGSGLPWPPPPKRWSTANDWRWPLTGRNTGSSTSRSAPTTCCRSTAANRVPTRAAHCQPARGPWSVTGLRHRRAPVGATATGPGIDVLGSVFYELHVGTFTDAGHPGRRDRATRPSGRTLASRPSN